jgi:hypothetical protein
MGPASFLRATVRKHRKEFRTEQGEMGQVSFRKVIVPRRRREFKSDPADSSEATSPGIPTRDSTTLPSHGSAARRRHSSSRDHSVQVVADRVERGLEAVAVGGEGRAFSVIPRPRSGEGSLLFRC